MNSTNSNNNKIKKIIINLLYAFFAQSVSLTLSIIMSVFVPKILGVEEFGYWQLFLFYSSYVGFFHFGLNDGIYLRYGGILYEELDYSIIGSQFWLSVFVQFVFSLMIALFSIFIIKDVERQFVLLMVAIILVIVNASNYLGYIFQMTNRTKIFSISVMVDKIFYLFFIILLYNAKETHFEKFIYLYIASKIICLFFCIFNSKELLFVKLTGFKIIYKEIITNISIGINLMMSNIASLLVLGIGRFFIDKIWGINTFGKLSFSLSLTNFFLLFIGQISMVLFPALKQTDEKNLKWIYLFARNSLSIFLAGIFLAYLPIEILLKLWLPQYVESLKYLVILLPLCVFEGKMNMLCGTYLKVLRKERVLLGINLLSLLISTIFALIAGYIINNIYAIVISMLLSIAIRSIIAEIYLSRLMGAKIVKDLLLECILVIIFIICTWFFGSLIGLISYAFSYLVFIYIKRDIIRNLVLSVKRVGKH